MSSGEISHALILAAGAGSRLGDSAAGVAKPMIRIAGEPLLQRNLRLLRDAGVRHVVINLHKHGDQISEYFGRGDRFGVEIAYSQEPTLLGTAGAALFARPLLGYGNVYIVYGDNLSTINLRALAQTHKEKRSSLTMALYQRPDARASGAARLDAADRIVDFVEKPATNARHGGWVNAGYYVMSPTVFDHISPSTPDDFARDVIPRLLARRSPVYGYRMTEGLWWIDTPEDLACTKRVFEASSGNEH